MNRFSSNVNFESGYNNAPLEDAFEPLTTTNPLDPFSNGYDNVAFENPLEDFTATGPSVAFPGGYDSVAFGEPSTGHNSASFEVALNGVPMTRPSTPLLDDPDNIAFGEASIDDLPVTGPSHVDDEMLRGLFEAWVGPELINALLGTTSQAQDGSVSAEGMGTSMSQVQVPGAPQPLVYPWDPQRLGYNPATGWLGINPNNSSVGSQPNHGNNDYQYGHAAWNATAVQPTLTVAQMLGEATASVLPEPVMQPGENNTVHRPYGPGCDVLSLSTVIGYERYCVLRKRDGRHCRYRGPSRNHAAFAMHILDQHIGMERRLIEYGELSRTDAQLLFTNARVQRAEEYAWRCPEAGCFVRMRHDTVRRHSKNKHPHDPVRAFRCGGESTNSTMYIVQDILDAEVEHESTWEYHWAIYS